MAWAGSQRSLGWLQHRCGGPYWKGDGHHLGRGQTWQRAPGGVFERATFRNGRNTRNQQQDNKSRTRTRKGQCGNTLEKEFKEWGVSQLRAPREVRRHDRQRHSLYPALPVDTGDGGPGAGGWEGSRQRGVLATNSRAWGRSCLL